MASVGDTGPELELEEAEKMSESKIEATEQLKRVQAANEGMKLLLNSKLKESEDLFKKSRFIDPQLNAGHSFVSLVKGLLSFEDDDLDNAYKLLEDTEKFCDPSRRFAARLRSGHSLQQLAITDHERLYRRSIVADCLLFEAVIVFLKQGFSSYVKGGYILRKAWKMYEKINNEVEQLCTTPCPIKMEATSQDKHVGTSLYDDNGGIPMDQKYLKEENGEDMVDAFTGSVPGLLSDLGEAATNLDKEINGMQLNDEDEECNGVDGNDNVDALSSGSSQSESVTGQTSQTGANGLKGSGFSLPEVDDSFIQNLDDIDSRLRGGIYFGYGLMNVIVSLIPPKLMKLANLFGFHGNRKLGLQALEFSSHSQDMKAPLARLSLLWYHTILRPFFALDGEQEDAGAEEALRLLREVESQYNDSAFFLYFHGKVHYLRSQLDDALTMYGKAAKLAREQREIEHICLFEKGWIHYLKLQYKEGLECFIKLKNETRWSACFYAYLAAVVAGIDGDFKQSRELFLQCSKLVKRKNNNLEKFCARRASVYKNGTTPLMRIEMILMYIEIIYLWRALPFCNEVTKLRLLELLEGVKPSNGIPFHYGMRALLRGCVLVSLNRFQEAEGPLNEAAGFEKSIKHDKHIMSFALYELAMIHINRDEFARARLLLCHAKDAFSGYEFEARLNFKVHSAMALVR